MIDQSSPINKHRAASLQLKLNSAQINAVGGNPGGALAHMRNDSQDYLSRQSAIGEQIVHCNQST